MGYSGVSFEGIVGSSHTGDIAIDDVTIFSGSCDSSTVLLTNQSIGGTLMPLFIRII